MVSTSAPQCIFFSWCVLAPYYVIFLIPQKSSGSSSFTEITLTEFKEEDASPRSTTSQVKGTRSKRWLSCIKAFIIYQEAGACNAVLYLHLIKSWIRFEIHAEISREETVYMKVIRVGFQLFFSLKTALWIASLRHAIHKLATLIGTPVHLFILAILFSANREAKV